MYTSWAGTYSFQLALNAACVNTSIENLSVTITVYDAEGRSIGKNTQKIGSLGSTGRIVVLWNYSYVIYAQEVVFQAFFTVEGQSMSASCVLTR